MREEESGSSYVTCTALYLGHPCVPCGIHNGIASNWLCGPRSAICVWGITHSTPDAGCRWSALVCWRIKRSCSAPSTQVVNIYLIHWWFRRKCAAEWASRAEGRSIVPVPVLGTINLPHLYFLSRPACPLIRLWPSFQLHSALISGSCSKDEVRKSSSGKVASARKGSSWTCSWAQEVERRLQDNKMVTTYRNSCAVQWIILLIFLLSKA